MKKNTDSFLKAVGAVICVMVAVYIAVSIIRSSGSSYTTYKAVHYEVGDGISTSGFVVRQEQIITGGSGVIVLTRGEGERVGVGQSVASSYSDENARKRQAQIEAKEEAIAQMEYAYTYAGTGSSNVALDADIVQQVQKLNEDLVREDFSAAQTNAETLKSLVLRRYITASDAEALQQRIAEAKAELSALQSQTQEASKQITVSQAGYFSGTVDGYESILYPEFLETATVSDLENLSGPLATPQNAIGRLVTSPRWYYVAVVDSDSIANCKVGNYVNVRFAYEFLDPLRMRISRISDAADGKRLLVLTTDRDIQTAVSCRAQTAEVIFVDRSGLRVPKTALYVNDEGVSGVYILSGARAVWKPVEIILDYGDYFIVKEDKTATTNLWPDDEIILTTEELFDGKVIEE